MSCTRYFDPNSPDDLKLLPPRQVPSESLGTVAFQNAMDGLGTIAARAEAIVIEAYTVSVYDKVVQTPGDRLLWAARFGGVVTAYLDPAAVKVDTYEFVCLRGYAVDPCDASDAFQTAMKREIADQLSWMITQSTRETSLSFAGEAQGGQRWYRGDADDRRRNGFGFWLKKYDVRRVSGIC